MGKEENICLEKRQASKKTKTIKVLQSCSRKGIPKISMEGKWLEELGFQIGDRLQVEYGNQYICISHAADMSRPLAVHEPDITYDAGIAGSEEPGRGAVKTKHIKVAASMHVRQRFAGVGQGFYYPERSKISMEGKWLEKAGFPAGNRVLVDCQEDLICIYPAV